MVRHLLCVLAAVFTLAPLATAAGDSAPPPALDVLLKPHQSDGKVDYVDITMTIASPAVAAGATLVHMPLVVASIPTQRYDGDAIQARDASGDLPLTIKEEPPTPMLSYRDWNVDRATSGDVTLTYRAKPRLVNAATRNGPLFDLRAEAGGLEGAGFTFLAPPVAPGPYRIHMHWDMSDMPAGSRGIWSLGEGDVTVMRPAEILATTFFYAGPVKSYPAKGSDTFTMYWLSEPPFDAAAAATMIKKLFDYVSVFFHDKGEAYRVFVRKNSIKGGGGTALARSFLFGYGTGSTPTVEGIESLIAHEMVHNWPTLDGDHSDTSWYTEGTAEYYSVLLSYRAGLTTAAQFLKGINEKADGYYNNPLQRLSNHAAEEIYWKDSRAGHVPYGRGWMYFTIVNAQIKAKSKGKRSLDDIVLDFVRRTQNGETVTPMDWANAVAAELGPQGRKDYEDMIAGKMLKPPMDAYGPCFRPYPVKEYPQELGFDAVAFNAEHRTIKNLVPGSAAELAGLHEGDEVVEGPDVGDPGFKYQDAVSLKVRRDGKDVAFTFVPRGKAVTGYRWKRNAKVSDAACKV